MKQHDHLEIFISKVMVFFVLSSGLIILAGGILMLWHYQGAKPDYSIFLQSSTQIFDIAQWHNLIHLQSQAIILLGFLWMIFGQIMRVILTTILFLKEKDLFFITISLIILFIMIHSFVIS